VRESSEPKPADAKSSIHCVETIGLVLLAFLVLIITIVRYWGHIAWSAR
jgi:hypothetical protein